MSKKDQAGLNAQSAAIQAVPQQPVPPAQVQPVCPTTVTVTPKLEAEYQLVLLDPDLNKHLPGGQAKRVTRGVELELWLEQEPGAPAFAGNAKAKMSGTGVVEIYSDAALTHRLDITQSIPHTRLSRAQKLKVWITAKTAGICTLELELDGALPNGFVAGPAAKVEVGVVALEMVVHQQDLPKVKALRIDPDAGSIRDYHKALSDQKLPDQDALAHEAKVTQGRLLHVQSNGNFGRAKVVIEKIDPACIPAACKKYKVVVRQDNVSGSLAARDKEFDGSEIKLPHELKLSALCKKAQTIWVEGTTATDDVNEAFLEVGLDRPAGGMAHTPLRNGDWARFTVVKIESVELDYTATPGEANAWDSAAGRFFINLKDDPDGRKIDIKAKLSKPIKDIVVHVMLIEDEKNRTKDAWGVDLPKKWKWNAIDKVVKHSDKANRDHYLHVSAKTDASGEAKKEVVLSRFGGDKFYLAAYIEQDPHLAKYTHGHKTLSKHEPVRWDKSILVWRKFWCTEIRVQGITVRDFMDAKDVYADVKVEMKENQPFSVPRATADAMSPQVVYPKCMLNYYVDRKTNKYKNNYPGDRSDGLMVGDATEKSFWPLVADKNDEPRHIRLLNAHGLWVEDGDSGTATTPRFAATAFPRAITVDKKTIDPPLQGGDLLASGTWKAWDYVPATKSFGNYRTGALVAADVTLDPNRSDPRVVQVNKPAGLVIAAAGTEVEISLKVRGATTFLGTSYDDGIVNVYTPHDEQDYQNTIAHELGHSFEQTAKAPPAGVPKHPLQYDRNGSHCNYKKKSCLMYESGPQPKALNRYCPVCHPYVLVQEWKTK